MFYSNNNNYMQDLYAYNQMPLNNTYSSYGNPAMPGAGNENMAFSTMNGGFAPNTNPMNNQNMFFNNQNGAMNPNMSSNMNNQMNLQNPNNLYPSIYRIINPVVSRVVSGTNLPYLTEDSLNNMVDTVYNIIEGQIDIEDDLEPISQNDVGNRGVTTTTTTNTNSQNPPSNTNTRTTTTTDTRNSINTQTNARSINEQTPSVSNISNSRNRRRLSNDSLLKDLIKILILRQIFSRNWMQQMPFNYSNGYQNQFLYNPNVMPF